MSREGMKAAARHAQKLPGFESIEQARPALLRARDEALRALETAAADAAVNLDYSPESLKHVEKWYFDLHESDFAGASLPRGAMENALAMYFGECLVRHAGFEWRVEAFVFEPGNFEIGVNRGLVTIMLASFGNLSKRPNNKRRQSLWRDFKRYST